MKAAILLLAVATGGCSSAFRGPETCTEIHYDTTYVLARWAGWPRPDALRIAAADAWTDQHAETNSVATEWRILGGIVHPLTLPRILFSGLGDIVTDGESPRRAFGRRTAEATAWAVPSLGLRLHFPSRGRQSPAAPAFFIHPVTGDLVYGNAEARRVLEQAFLDLQVRHDDVEGTLALLGIGLHAVQDSFKHCGFTPAMGHIGARPDPDHACEDPATALASAEATLHALRYARQLLAGRSSMPPSDWKQLLSQAMAGPTETTDARWSALVEQDEGRAPREDRLEEWRRQGGAEAFDRAILRAKAVLR